MYRPKLSVLMSTWFAYALFRLICRFSMSPPFDWLSRLLDLVPVRGHLDLRCFYGAPWRIDQDRAAAGEIPYHVVLGGSAVLDDHAGGPPTRLLAGDILLLPHRSAHVMHHGRGVPAPPAPERAMLNWTI